VETFILTLKPYNPLETHDSITMHLKVKSHDYLYKTEFDWRISEVTILDIYDLFITILTII
jgi:hypothetical protein